MIKLISYLYFRYYILISYFMGFSNASLGISRIYGPIGNRARYQFYKHELKRVGRNVYFPFGITFSQKHISIGDNVRFGPNNTIGLVDFGNDIVIAQNVHFLSGKNQHSYNRKDLSMIHQPGKLERLKISDDVWIGAGSIVLASISEGSIIGSLSLVNKTFESYSIFGGNPAKLIGSR